MSQQGLKLGAWVRAKVTLDDCEGTTFCEAGDIGHVVDELPDDDGWVNVLFERTGRVTGCLPDDICRADMPQFSGAGALTVCDHSDPICFRSAAEKGKQYDN